MGYVHTFSGPGTFCVSTVGNGPVNPAGGPNTASYFVVAGGGDLFEDGGHAKEEDVEENIEEVAECEAQHQLVEVQKHI